MSNELVKHVNKNFTIVPQNLTEAMTFADLIAKSSFCPDKMKGKAGDVLIAIQMGAEIGLSPMQAIQNIAVIGGRPTIWGDAQLAVVISHPDYISHREWKEGNIKDGTRTAYCGITRKNSEEEIQSFSMTDAKTAGLWGKSGTWTQYPDRMLQMRARSFAIRDKFADALKGISQREEVEDYHVIPSKSTTVIHESTVIQPAIEAEVVISPEQILQEEVACANTINACSTMQELRDAFQKLKKSHQHILDHLVKCKDAKKAELEAADKKSTEEFLAGMEGDIE